MITIRLNGVDVKAEEGWTILEICKFYGIPIPTLCYNEGLSPYGACRLCVVEIGTPPNTKLVSSCTYPIEEGLVVHTHTKRVLETRRMLIELLVALCPTSKVIQDLASEFGITKDRFKPKYADCVLCGLCVRMCEEQMQAKAIGFVNRGYKSKISTPFDMKSEVCRTCGGCIYICPTCQLRCQGAEPPSVLCNSCLNISYPCAEVHNEVKCYMDPCAACLLEEAEKKKKGEEK
jgi:NADH dehydrogenase/NADH:ubiquinone oxidoreductase subunit G